MLFLCHRSIYGDGCGPTKLNAEVRPRERSERQRYLVLRRGRGATRRAAGRYTTSTPRSRVSEYSSEIRRRATETRVRGRSWTSPRGYRVREIDALSGEASEVRQHLPLAPHCSESTGAASLLRRLTVVRTPYSAGRFPQLW